ncbi:hypothetical protein AVEN_53308-1 [Araneus ventricosus]|uniref:Uncharacterized protein n=1 Tax=Araneus ventricosus TaxID=182803 RepID=A0A4Y2A9T0_ARAVE|nr:hypothetical protein AVEN_53308-1 [Araneus ventricosus]
MNHLPIHESDSADSSRSIPPLIHRESDPRIHLSPIPPIALLVGIGSVLFAFRIRIRDNSFRSERHITTRSSPLVRGQGFSVDNISIVSSGF